MAIFVEMFFLTNGGKKCKINVDYFKGSLNDYKNFNIYIDISYS
jgi:hypothetical protein